MKKGQSKVQPGDVCERLLVLDQKRYNSERHGRMEFKCQCSCGNELWIPSYSLSTGNTRSCGCLHKEEMSKRLKKHGESNGGGKVSSEYESWCGMIGRCTNRNNEDYKYYGGRGITICRKWRHSYASFLSDMGRKPTPKHTIERKDVNGNYTPKNCCWVTQAEQCRNRRDNRRITIDGETKILAEWARVGGINQGALLYRLDNGWDPKVAVFTPSRKLKI